jgi:hypothetical protein
MCIARNWSRPDSAQLPELLLWRSNRYALVPLPLRPNYCNMPLRAGGRDAEGRKKKSETLSASPRPAPIAILSWSEGGRVSSCCRHRPSTSVGPPQPELLPCRCAASQAAAFPAWSSFRLGCSPAAAAPRPLTWLPDLLCLRPGRSPPDAVRPIYSSAYQDRTQEVARYAPPRESLTAWWHGRAPLSPVSFCVHNMSICLIRFDCSTWLFS